MIGTAHVLAAARCLRVATMMLVLGLLVGFVALQSFVDHYGDATAATIDVRSSDAALTAAIARQEARGLSCSTEPVLTDVVLFQEIGRQRVTVITFDEAVTASAAREGWVRSYCA